MIFESKFNLNDEIFAMDENKIQKFKIETIYGMATTGEKDCPRFVYRSIRFSHLGDMIKKEFEENKVFKTKEELIEKL